MNDFLSEFYNPKLHAAYFTYKGIDYSFAGWWILDWGDDSKIYDTIEDFLKDPVFDGKRLEEICDELTDIDFDFEP